MTNEPPPTDTVLETERLRLRRLTTDDAEMMLAQLEEPSFHRWIGDRGVRTLEQARQYILDGPVASYEKNGYGILHVSLKTDGTPIGTCGVLKRDSLDDADIGFALFPRFWSRGYAFEASRACLDHARDVLGLPRVVAITQPDNASSIRLLERLGLHLEKTIELPKFDGSGSETLNFYAIDF